MSDGDCNLQDYNIQGIDIVVASFIWLGDNNVPMNWRWSEPDGDVVLVETSR
jgi:hypothetical protein